MSTLIKRGKKWTATARLPDTFQGQAASKSISQTFAKKDAAKLWLSSTETAMKLGNWRDPRLEPKAYGPLGWPEKRFAEALDDYRIKVTPEKKGASQEAAMLQMFAREEFAQKRIRDLTVSDFVDFRDARNEAGKSASTIRNNLNTISAVYEWLIHEKSVDIANPIASLRKRRRGVPQPTGHRERRLFDGEEEAITKAIEGLSVDPTRRQWRALFPLLLDTGMRLGEAVSIECAWIRREYGFVCIPDSKNGTARHVALSDRAYAGLLDLTDGEPADSKVFRFTDWVAKDAWRNEIRVAAGCQDLRIHDLRHEALSRMAARGADLKTLMRQSGHKTVAVLMRYLNPTPAEQRSRLFPATEVEKPS
ncbi:integrase [Rhodopseudomonas rhenobacensis]|uniref:Integrase n=1 Tax=Rhodopseudomonas rhenobacensis TaxID=87461 RepID=A0A7W7Z0W5_9BRAD|nr:site-specific integrase [Rhodopseudomonas rhenobacensis]MBB5045970.1 integrase [Rhodopseudomonas rhenobacensis]